MEEKTVEEWKQHVQPALESKISEFELVGYKDVTEEMLWRCLEETVWKGNPKKRLHEIVKDIFHLQPNNYMNFMAKEAMQKEDDDLKASIQAVMDHQPESRKESKKESR